MHSDKTRAEIAAIVARLDALQSGDRECSHIDADRLLLVALLAVGAGDVVEAYKRVEERCGAFWYA